MWGHHRHRSYDASAGLRRWGRRQGWRCCHQGSYVSLLQSACSDDSNRSFRWTFTKGEAEGPLLCYTYVQSLLPTHKGMHGACALPTTAKWADPHNKRYSILNRDPQQFTLSLRKDLPRRIDVWWVYWDLQTGLWKKQILRIMTSRPCFSSSVAAVASGRARNYR
jgi:hypothetical protein